MAKKRRQPESEVPMEPTMLFAAFEVACEQGDDEKAEVARRQLKELDYEVSYVGASA